MSEEGHKIHNMLFVEAQVGLGACYENVSRDIASLSNKP